MQKQATNSAVVPDAHALRVYEEVSKSHNAIADFRAKLLGLLPAGTGTAAFFLLENSGGTKAALSGHQLAAIGIFGFVVTFGLFMYDLRGIQDCVLLRERGKHLEFRLGIPPEQSQFRRGDPRLFGLADEVGAGWIVYTAVLAAWAYVAGSKSIFAHWGVVAVPAAYLAALVLFRWVGPRLRTP